MTPRMRFLKLLRRETIDRVPLDIQGFNNLYSPTVEGFTGLISHEEKTRLEDPAKKEIAERIQDKTIAHHCIPTWINRYLVIPPQRIRERIRKETEDEIEIFREIDTPKGKLAAIVSRRMESVGTIWTKKYPVETREDIEKIRSIPWELPINLSPPDPADFPQDLFDRRVVYSYVSTPAACVAGMMKFEDFLILCCTEMSLIRDLVELCERRIMKILDVVLSKAAIDIVLICGSEQLTTPIASPTVFEELIQGQEKRIINKVHEMGALAHVHCHGNVKNILNAAIDRGADYFEPVEPPPNGDISFAEAKEIIDGKIILGGNIELDILENSNKESVEKAVLDAFKGRKTHMVLATSAGSTIPLFNKHVLANYHKMIDLWEELSPY